jgi:uncharacterized protein
MTGLGIRLSATDLSNFLSCRHLTDLDRARAANLAKPRLVHDVGAEALERRGMEHEQRVRDEFAANGWEIRSLRSGTEEGRAEATLAAMAEGIDVIYQGVLTARGRYGAPDFLVRADLLAGASEASEGYEVVDAKLARTAKARAVLQTAFYSQLVAELAGPLPDRMHLALGNGELRSLRVADYAAYARQVFVLLEEAVAGQPVFPPAGTYPEPVEHCASCRWRLTCTDRRRADDDLSLIAGITARQRRGLKSIGVTTRRGLSGLGSLPAVEGVNAASLARVNAQAVLQVQGEDEGRLIHRLLDPERDEDGELVPNRGLLALPAPSPGDLFFDIEGARYYSEDGREFGLQYLFGIVDSADLDVGGRGRYHQFWAFDRRGERKAFENLVDFVTERRARHPELHVYHYNHYEPTSLDHLAELHESREDVLGRLMGRFASREDEVDDLFRQSVFVDLYRVVRQGLQASIESYSLKQVERLAGFERAIDLGGVGDEMVRFETALETGGAEHETDAIELIAGYNEDDCRAASALRDWLEEQRSALADQLGRELPRPVPPEAAEDHTDPDIKVLKDALLAGVPEDGRTAEHDGRALVADLLEWHRREDKPKWWRYFTLKKLTDAELVGEADALGQLQRVEHLGVVKKSQVIRFSFPPQEHPLSVGEQVEDTVTGAGWTVDALDEDLCLIDLRCTTKYAGSDPTSLIKLDIYRTPDHRRRLRDLATAVLGAGDGDWAQNAAFDLLLGRSPNAGQPPGCSLTGDDEETTVAARRLAVSLSTSHLPIQGPPGSGKTYTAAHQVLALIESGKRVGITANSHAVIANLLDEIHDERAKAGGPTIKIGQAPDGERLHLSPHATPFDTNKSLAAALADGAVDVAGGTTWLWCRDDAGGSVHTLIVDEAGQMSLANVLAASMAASNLILVGDPLQLDQPSQAAHPPAAGATALERILGDHQTMPADRGLFIDATRRMHPDVCAFISESFYEGRLSPIPGLERQEVLGPGRATGSGLRTLDVTHEGNDNSSREEADAVAVLVAELKHQTWQDCDGARHAIGLEGILVVTPFNAQIRAIHQSLDAQGLSGVRVGTVDKFQGQQAPVVIYSTASSTAEDAPRGMQFLYNMRRLNVAISRAQCLAILVSSPELVRVACRTPDQIVLANALCRYRELARPLA